jgi:cyanate lyase
LVRCFLAIWDQSPPDLRRRKKALIEEEFGDGIMSAIDFDMKIDREANPKGDRVKITMSGKFLPYKYYGNGQGIPEVEYKEE